MAADPRTLESLLAFWAAAGVDTLYEDAPRDRTAPILRREPARPEAARAASPMPPTGPGSGPATGGPPAPTRREAPSAPRPIDLSPPAADPGVIDQARRLAAEAGDLEALKAAIAAFDGCPLKASARQAVVSRGRGDAPVMVIGEGPGAEEDIQGAPFVGRAGQLLDRMLAAAGLTERVFITNTVFWRPPGNRTPTAAEQAVCAPFLERAITLVRPRLLLLAGGASAKAMLKTNEGILSLRGRWFDWRSADGALAIPALPTLHPAFLLRQPAAKKKSWEDLLRLTDRLDRPHEADGPAAPAG